MSPRELSANSLFPPHSHHQNYRFTPSSTSLSPQELSVLSLFHLTLTTRTIETLLLPHYHHKNYRLTPSASLTPPEIFRPHSHHQNYRFSPSSASLTPPQIFPPHSLQRTIGLLPLPPHSHHQNYFRLILITVSIGSLLLPPYTHRIGAKYSARRNVATLNSLGRCTPKPESVH